MLRTQSDGVTEGSQSPFQKSTTSTVSKCTAAVLPSWREKNGQRANAPESREMKRESPSLLCYAQIEQNSPNLKTRGDGNEKKTRNAQPQRCEYH